MLIHALIAVTLVSQPQPQPDRPFYPPGRPGEQPRQTQDGPWNHQVHFATSDDGLTFTETPGPIMKQASVPDIIQLARDLPKKADAAGAKGTLMIYVVDARSPAPDRQGGVSRLTSTDGGKSWSSPAWVTFDFTKRPETGGRPVDPSIVQLEDGRLRMFYYWMEPPTREQQPREPGELPTKLPGRDPGRPEQPKPDNPAPPPPARPHRHVIYSALSEDGILFKAEEGARFADDDITDPEIVKAGDQWLMFLSRGQETLLARSGDGLRFDRDRDFVLRGGGVPGAVVLADGRVRVYQSSRDGIISVVFDPKSGMFKSDEGIRIKGPCADPAVFPSESGGYVMVLKRFMNAPQPKGPGGQ